MSFFNVGALGGNPLATPIGQKIEQATDGSLASENWGLNMEICDLVNASPDGPRDAIKALKKRLHLGAGPGRNYTVVMYALTVLEACVKNCGRPFHVLVCNREFVMELVKLIGPKNDPPTAVQEKVLSLIQSWADAFRHQPELSGVVQVHQELRAKGIEFPMTDLDAMAPIYTPQRTVPDGEAAPGSPHTQPTPAPPAAAQVVPAGLSASQLAKLQSELDVVTANMAVLNEMLTELRPGQEHPSDLQLLQELHSTCRAMQGRIVELIGKLSNDEITAELLRINDELNNLFLRYSRFEKNRGTTPPSQVLGKAMGVPTLVGASGPVEAAQDSLIDLRETATGGATALDSKLAGLSLGSATSQLSQLNTVVAQSGTKGAVAGAKGDISSDTDEFDMFAQSRNTSYETSKTTGSTYKDNQNMDTLPGALGATVQARTQPPQTVPRESDFDEMAAWLDNTTEEGTVATEDSVTSSEFDRFLAERAAVADTLPTLPSVPSTTVGPPTSNQSKGKRKEDESLFAL